MNMENPKYIATMGYKIYHLVLNTNRGEVKFAVWDTSGQERTGALRQPYYANSDGAILMFGLNSYITFKSMHSWRYDIHQNNGHIPIVAIGSFADATPHKVKERDIIRLTEKYSMLSLSMSTTTQPTSELAMPFLLLAEDLMGMESGTLHLL